MTSHNFISRSFVLVALLLAAICVQPTHASASGDADLRELSRYTLTMADVNKYVAANSEIAKLPKADENGDEDSDGSKASLDDMVARIGKLPEARKAIEASGLTVRQYAVITMALFQSAMAQFAVEQGADPAKVARDAGVNPANIRFVKEHKAELDKLKQPAGDE